MKTTAITTISSGSYIPELEEIIQKKDAYLKELARKNGKHFAQTNLPAPFGDSLLPYFGELKSGYEELAAQTCQFLLPDMHIPEAKLETDFAKEKIKQIDEEVKKREEQNRNDQYDLGDYNPGNIPMRIKTALISTGVIGVGEIAFNTKAFSVTGENLLFSLVISTSATFAVFILSHV
jgi:hypothetical protein